MNIIIKYKKKYKNTITCTIIKIKQKDILI